MTQVHSLEKIIVLWNIEVLYVNFPFLYTTLEIHIHDSQLQNNTFYTVINDIQ